MKEVYQLNNNGHYISTIYADPDPLEQGNWLIPAGCIEVEPPLFDIDNQIVRWDGTQWLIENKQVLSIEDTSNNDITNNEIIVSPLQARKALSHYGLRETVENYIQQQPIEIRDAWEYALQINRTDSILTSAASNLNISDDKLDEIFKVAETY